MNRLLLPVLALSGLIALTSCHFGKKSALPKENPAISAELEADFMKRWVDKRTTELAAGGVAQEAARSQAAEEFRARYPYLGAAKK